jgi:hypothetical protein
VLLVSSFDAEAVTEAEAEEIRLIEEMRSLFRRNVWVGVDRMYRQLIENGTALTSPQHLQGAHAAQALGDVGSCYQRLREAARLDPSKPVIDWLWSIDTQYGEVEITAAAGVVLSAEVTPLDVVHRTAIERAAVMLLEDGRFVGRLPVGNYSVAAEVLVVTTEQRVELAL